VVEVNESALAAAQGHTEFARTRFLGGAGTRLDQVRAEQEQATTAGQLAVAEATLTRAEEALGVLLGRDGPLDVDGEPNLPDSGELVGAEKRRQDVIHQDATTAAAVHVSRDSWTDYLPSLSATFQPFYQNPPTLINPLTGWQAFAVLTLPIYDGGLRYGYARERRATAERQRLQLDGLTRQARSEVRAADDGLRHAEEARVAAVAAAKLANEALDLSNLAYRAGATTNLEVIDAERRARDAGVQAALAEDAARQARLDLLVAAGRFP
jgi:outer membrane protein TolC